MSYRRSRKKLQRLPGVLLVPAKTDRPRVRDPVSSSVSFIHPCVGLLHHPSVRSSVVIAHSSRATGSLYTQHQKIIETADCNDWTCGLTQDQTALWRSFTSCYTPPSHMHRGLNIALGLLLTSTHMSSAEISETETSGDAEWRPTTSHWKLQYSADGSLFTCDFVCRRKLINPPPRLRTSKKEVRARKKLI